MEKDKFSVKKRKERKNRMAKEFIICTIIIIGIVIGNGVTQGYTKNSIEDINAKLESLEQTLNEELEINNNEKKNEQIESEEKTMNGEEEGKITEIENKGEEIYKEWEDMFSKLAYYIEHEELEKVSRNIENVKTYVKLEQYEDAIKEINEVIFVLNHIEEKYSFNLQNIF